MHALTELREEAKTRDPPVLGLHQGEQEGTRQKCREPQSKRKHNQSHSEKSVNINITTHYEYESKNISAEKSES